MCVLPPLPLLSYPASSLSGAVSQVFVISRLVSGRGPDIKLMLQSRIATEGKKTSQVRSFDSSDPSVLLSQGRWHKNVGNVKKWNFTPQYGRWSSSAFHNMIINPYKELDRHCVCVCTYCGTGSLMWNQYLRGSRGRGKPWARNVEPKIQSNRMCRRGRADCSGILKQKKLQEIQQYFTAS